MCVLFVKEKEGRNHRLDLCEKLSKDSIFSFFSLGVASLRFLWGSGFLVSFSAAESSLIVILI